MGRTNPPAESPGYLTFKWVQCLDLGRSKGDGLAQGHRCSLFGE